MDEGERKSLLETDDPLFYYSVDMIIICAALLTVGTYLNGVTALLHAAVCVLTCVLAEAVGCLLVGQNSTLGDLSAVYTGLLIALSLPACAPLWLGAAGCVFAVIAVKLVFGGARHAPFVPAAAGVCFLQLCFSRHMSTYPASSCGAQLIFSDSRQFESGQSLLQMLESGNTVKLNIMGIASLLCGKYPGAIGTTSVLCMVGVLVFLILRRTNRLAVSLGYIGCAAAAAFLFPRVYSGRLSSVVLELSAGSLLFVALLIISEPVTAPRKAFSGFLYGAAAGALCMLLRRVSVFSDGGFFSVMLLNAVYPAVSAAFSDIRLPRLKRRGRQEEPSGDASELKSAG